MVKCCFFYYLSYGFFLGNQREVSITGEVYFEIKKDRKNPFIVRTNKEEIKVLGTRFNVNAYDNEAAIKTSLLEGSVRVGGIILKPGEAFLDGKVIHTNVDQDVAWKNGLFNFDGVSLEQAMRQIARWYDVEIIYKGSLPELNFYGKIQRGLKLQQALKVLSGLGVDFYLENDRKLIITKTSPK